MHRGFQLSLLATGQGKGYLFGTGILDKYLREHETTAIVGQQERAKVIQDWLQSLETTDASESSLEQKFISEVVCSVLGYTPYPAPAGMTASIYTKPSSKITGIKRTPDAVLGAFSDVDHRFVAAVELKTPGTDLDLPQSGYGYETPVEQGFHYGKNILGVRWVIVSDMRLIRLYSVEAEDEYEELDLAECVDAAGNSTAAFRKLIFLLHHDYLIKNHRTSSVSLLYVKSAERQIAIRDSFYEVYYSIRADLFDAVRKASGALTPIPSRQELLAATQRLLDRLLFIYYCEDHPQQLIKNGTFESVTHAARLLPGRKDTRVYEYLKQFFREIDAGSPPSSGLRVAGYNGELFKEHPIIDRIDLPDSLHDRKYTARAPRMERIIHGVWGLHVFDFWSELNEYLLGHIFEESLSDLDKIGVVSDDLVVEKMRERKAGGIFFTSSILADFLCASAVHATLDDLAPLHGDDDEQLRVALEKRVASLLALRAVDFACGSGAFLTSMLRELLVEFWRLQSALASLKAKNGHHEIDLLAAASVVGQARQLPGCVFGVDQLPQAVEIAKLAIWLRSARKDEKVLDLSKNIVAADSLDLPGTFDRLGRSAGSFDIVVGNPPWGGEVDPQTYRRAVDYLGLSDDDTWDSWELFLMLAIRALRDGGRLALVLPDSLFYPHKARIREVLLSHTDVEKVHGLGPDWFGPDVRMGTVVVQARRGPSDRDGDILCMLLAGKLRGRVIEGAVPLTQVEAQRSRLVPTARVVSSPTRELEIFRSADDDRIIATMAKHSVHLSGENGLCARGRGEELNKAGLLWICPSCLNPTTPGAKRKGGGYKEKRCETCNHLLTAKAVDSQTLVSASKPDGKCVPFIDGDDINRRYAGVEPQKWLRLGIPGWSYKDASLYRAPKILLRQAGVGICAVLDETRARCPQSVYIYRLRASEAAKGYRHEFVLASLLSRTMAYFVFKRFGEVDPAKAHAKLTHRRLADLPIPVVDFRRSARKKAHDTVVANVRRLLSGKAEIGGEEDREIEHILREMWGLSGADGAYINGEFFDLPDSQALRDLFPDGAPRPVREPLMS